MGTRLAHLLVVLYVYYKETSKEGYCNIIGATQGPGFIAPWLLGIRRYRTSAYMKTAVGVVFIYLLIYFYPLTEGDAAQGFYSYK